MTRNVQRTSKAAVCLLLSLMLAVPVAFGSPTSAHAVTAAEKQAEAEAALASLNAMQEQLDQASADYGQALSEQQEAEDSRDAAQTRIDELNGQISEMQEHLGDRARTMYRSGSSSMLDLLLGSTSFQAFATNWDMLAQINESDAEMVQQTKDLRAEVEDEKAVYEEQARVAQEKADEAKRIEEEAASTVASMQATYDSLSAEAAELLEQERAAEEAARAAAAAAAVEAAAREAAAANTNRGGGGGGGAPSYVPSTGNAIVDRAYSQLGKPYVWGATGPNSFDCSGLVGYALTGGYSRVGTTYTFMSWPRVSDPQPGDICTNDHHCGIYIGGGQMIHAPRTGDVVKVGPVHSGMIFVRQP
ncbi:coiled-coil domain-containing protein [Enteroscipio rubneri]|uniref:coiled-coil domain-containing protein n=2 Tax=Enteroscipio rubneri TaxID=2070686 RepID=UPI003209D844